MNLQSHASWIWMPHAAHFICSDRCNFRLATHVSGFIISTVGEMKLEELKEFPSGRTPNKDGWMEIGASRLYETMVFTAEKSNKSCGCQFVQGSGSDHDMLSYNSAEEATEGHYATCWKFHKKYYKSYCNGLKKGKLVTLIQNSRRG